MLLFLIGMPGSGKTFWLKHLANKIDFLPVDLDQKIEAFYQTTIPKLFKISEAYFREREKEILEKVIAETQKDALISTGGGTPCFHGNLSKMKAAGKVIYLKNEVRTLASRLMEGPTERPLLSGLGAALTEKLKFVEQERKVFYEQADLIIQADHLTLPIFDELLKPFLNP